MISTYNILFVQRKCLWRNDWNR